MRRDSPDFLRILLQKLICKLLLWHILDPRPASLQKGTIWWKWKAPEIKKKKKNQEIWVESQLCNNENHFTFPSFRFHFWEMGMEARPLPLLRRTGVWTNLALWRGLKATVSLLVLVFVHYVSLSEQRAYKIEHSVVSNFCPIELSAEKTV